MCIFPNLEFSCCKCPECRQRRSDMWSIRGRNEAENYDVSVFLDLTYANNPVTLRKSDVQNFLKRLRKKIHPGKIKYILKGEYGEQNFRPHYHLIVFGWRPKDMTYFYQRGKIKYYRSKTLLDLWGHGHVLVSPVSRQAIRYAVGYGMKKSPHPPGTAPPFNTFSQGIGREWLQSNAHKDTLYSDGKKYNFRLFPILKKYREQAGIETPDYVPKIDLTNNADFINLENRVYKSFRRFGQKELLLRSAHDIMKSEQALTHGSNLVKLRKKLITTLKGGVM